MITLLDGPLGTELTARGVSTKLPWWSASALIDARDVVASIHRDYAEAGATVHTANTFRTKRRTVGDRWLELTQDAVRIARGAVKPDHRVAGSISPLEDCYRPDLSPGESSRSEHRELAEALAEAGCDLLLCETFPHVEEAITAVEESVRTGLPTWLAFTAGPDANLLTPEQMAVGAKRAVDAGASAVLVNCTPARETLPFVQAIANAITDVPFGAYANAGHVDDEVGWNSTGEISNAQRGAELYRDLAKQWIAADAKLIGGCCGTTPQHIAEIHTTVNRPSG